MDDLPEILHRHGWNHESLAASFRDGFKCAYCALDFLRDYDAYRSWDTDHILPKCDYPALVTNPLNLISACRVCNLIKGQWDPNREGEPILKDGEPLTEPTKQELVARATAYVQSVRAAWNKKLNEMRECIGQMRRRESGRPAGS